MSEPDLEAIGLLQDPARRSLYTYVVAEGREVSRNEAAEAVGLSRTLAAFHLDRLARAAAAEATLYDNAREHGSATARALAQSTGARSLTLGDLERHLAARGYEPYQTASRLRLRNCPFHSAAHEFPVVVCGMNQALLEGMLAGGGLAETHAARLDPQPAECCVVICSKTNAN